MTEPMSDRPITGPSVRERPIIFSGAMVRALLSGAKTQTRRVVVPRGRDLRHIMLQDDTPWLTDHSRDRLGRLIVSRYGYPGDRLWVREAWASVSSLNGSEREVDRYSGIRYRATRTKAHASAWKPSIHMPREASRLTLEITNVRVERVQDITDADAIAEGIAEFALAALSRDNDERPRDQFRYLWDSLNAKRGYSWERNAWVWVISFRKVASDAQTPAAAVAAIGAAERAITRP